MGLIISKVNDMQMTIILPKVAAALWKPQISSVKDARCSDKVGHSEFAMEVMYITYYFNTFKR